jgi:hypothetical protein
VQNAPGEQVMEESLTTKPFTNDDESSEKFTNKSEQGTIRGAISLITGTSIGSGILALPASTAPAVCFYEEERHCSHFIYKILRHKKNTINFELVIVAYLADVH